MYINNASEKFSDILSEIKMLSLLDDAQKTTSRGQGKKDTGVRMGQGKKDTGVRMGQDIKSMGSKSGLNSNNEILDHLRYKEYNNRVACSFYLDIQVKMKLDYIAKSITTDLRSAGLYRTKKDITRSQIIEMLMESVFSMMFDEDTNYSAL